MIGDRNNPRFNNEGAPDPTAFEAIEAAARSEKLKKKAAFLRKIIFYIVTESGFRLIHPLDMADRSGYLYRQPGGDKNGDRADP